MDKLRRFVKHPDFPLLILLAAAALLGLVIMDDYGASWDEPQYYEYGEATLNAYSVTDRLNGTYDHEAVLGPGDLRYYGPAYLMAARGALALLKPLFPRAMEIDVRHLVTYGCFLLGVLFFYRLALRWVSRPAAFVITLLYASEPVLFGDAWINPKDTPLLVFFLGSFYFGLLFADHARAAFVEATPAGGGLKAAYRAYPRKWALAFNFVATVVFIALACNLRLIGGLAALMVAALWADRLGRKAVPVLLIGGLISVGLFFALWPYLWQDTLPNLVGIFRRMSDFPEAKGVLYDGVLISSRDLPAGYLPRLLLMTLTEPAILLWGAGLIAAAYRFIKKGPRRLEIALLLAWFFVPVLYVMLIRPPLYDNYRHFLFILPAAFLVSGLALDWLYARLRGRLVQVLIALLLLAPGLIDDVSLHPYQYAYYNRASGGIQAAAHRYEVDYWLTCYRALTEQMNAGEREPVDVYVMLTPELVQMYAGPNLRVQYLPVEQPLPHGALAVLPLRWEHILFYPDEPVAYRVQVQGVDLCVAKRIE